MPTNSQRQVAANIDALLRMRAWSQVDLAAATGIAQSTISRKLRSLSDWSLTDLDRLSAALGVTVPELTGALPPAATWDARNRPASLPIGRGPRFLVNPVLEYDGVSPGRVTVPYRRFFRALALALLAALVRPAADPYRVAFPHTTPVLDPQDRALREPLTPPVTFMSVAAAYRTGVTLPRRLPTHTQRVAYCRPGLAAMPRRHHVQHRCGL